MNTFNKIRERVLMRVSENGLVSVMNDTKWMKLIDRIKLLNFLPPYQIKNLLSDLPYPEDFNDPIYYLGDYSEGILPFYAIEWILINPKYYYTRGKLLNDGYKSVYNELKQILIELKIPYHEENSMFYIYGYINSNTKLS
ncbi:DUF6678 family protein [Microcystis aeruginosa]|jgi:hypothetical protein|uniref:DUF6678 family protein n=1 Tax=Microcystis aeruginosa TaxID=1126 RepID=UPI00187E69FA|nr:DUF6678 family protein [Microcystis aeruginosa]MBE8995242.1 hypothetical protein [Microcystis aeruginosa LEGE 91341]